MRFLANRWRQSDADPCMPVAEIVDQRLRRDRAAELGARHPLVCSFCQRMRGFADDPVARERIECIVGEPLES